MQRIMVAVGMTSPWRQDNRWVPLMTSQKDGEDSRIQDNKAETHRCSVCRLWRGMPAYSRLSGISLTPLKTGFDEGVVTPVQLLQPQLEEVTEPCDYFFFYSASTHPEET
jgi:hypothetical protein